MLYVVPSTVSLSPSLVHVTLVAGEPVEVQVRVREAESYVRLDIFGGAEGMNNITYQNITRYVVAHQRGITRDNVLLARIYMNSYFTPCFSHVKLNTVEVTGM